MLLASIYRRDYLAPLTSAGYRRRTDDLHVWRVIPWMELAISSLDLPPWPAGPAKWTVGRRRRACSTRGNASYRLRLASFMHIHGRPAGGQARARGRTGARTRARLPNSASQREGGLSTYVRWMHTAAVHSRRARSSISLFLGSRFCHDLAYACRALLVPTSSYHGPVHPRSLCRSVPLESGLRSYLATRLLRSGSPPFKSHSCASRSLNCVLVELQQPRVERMRLDAGYLSGDTRRVMG